MIKIKRIFLTYNEWSDDVHKGINIDHKGLSINEIKKAIDNYYNSKIKNDINIMLDKTKKIRIRDKVRKDFCEPYNKLEFVTISKVDYESMEFDINEDNGENSYYFKDVDFEHHGLGESFCTKSLKEAFSRLIKIG